MTDDAASAPTGWLERRLAGRTPGRAGARVLARLDEQPREMSYASTAEAARLAGVNVATVVRTAQALGYSGWPALRADLRSRYLSRLSAAQLLGEHTPGAPDGVAAEVLRRDLANLRDLADLLDEAGITRIAARVRAARRTLVLGSGSYAAPGLALAHQGSSLGLDVRLLQAGGTSLVNAVAVLGPDDLLVVIELWRSPHEIREAMSLAADRGVGVVLLSDRADDAAGLADEVLTMPSEGASTFPSLVGAITLVQGIVAAIVAQDPKGAGAALDRTEGAWARFGLFPDPAAERDV